MRLMIGIVQMLVTPGSSAACPSSARSCSSVNPARHCSRGLRCTTVSVMFSGDGSVDVSARPTFATAYSTSGTCMSAVFCMRAISVFCSSEMLGSEIGMKRRSPSLSGGMNSVPMRAPTTRAPASSRAAPAIVAHRCESAPSSDGR